MYLHVVARRFGIFTPALSLIFLLACSRQEPVDQSVDTQAKASDASAIATGQSASGPALAYVSNQNGQISVIDLDTFEVLREIDPGSGSPRGIGISDDGKWLVTANREGGNLSIINRSTGKLRTQVEIGENPEFVRVRDQLAFVSFEPEAIAGPPPKPGSAEALALEKQREEDDDTEPAQIAIVDLDQGKVIRNIVGGIETEGIEFSHDANHILITNESDNTVTVHNIESGERIATVDTAPHGPRPRGIRRRPDGGYVASLEYGNKLMMIDASYQFENTVDTGKVPYGLAYSPDEKTLAVALAHGNALQLFDAENMTEIAQVPTGKRCWHFSYTPDASHILVVCGRSHEVVVIDAKTNQVRTRIKDRQLPWGIVTWPKSVGSLDVPTN